MSVTLGLDSQRFLPTAAKAPEAQRAADLFCCLRSQALRGQLWSALTHRKGRLLSLASVEAACTVVDCRDIGRRTVPINRIRGSSSSRCDDFDVDFRPLHAHDQDRWLGVAAARLRGARLPPVELIEVKGVYFVVDGHHRISVARALGEVEIAASVTTWQVAGPLPWEKQEKGTCSTVIPATAGIHRRFRSA